MMSAKQRIHSQVYTAARKLHRIVLPPQSVRRIITLLCGFAAAMWLFAGVALGVHYKLFAAFDQSVLLWLAQHRHVSLSYFLAGFSAAFNPLAYAAIGVGVLAVLISLRRYGSALFVALVIGGSGVLNLSMKVLFSRQRPHITPWLITETGSSFPSGHAMASLALLFALVVLLWQTKLRWPMLIMAASVVVLVGVSRPYFGVHYPSDIIAGWLTTAAWGSAVLIAWFDARAAWRLWQPRSKKHKSNC